MAGPNPDKIVDMTAEPLASRLDYLRVERALAGNLPVNELNSEERDFCENYQPAFEIGRMAGRMAQGYYAHKAAIEVAKDPRADGFIPAELRVGQAVPVGDVMRKDGSGHVYDFRYYLAYARTNSEMARDLDRVWIVGSLVAVGGALEKRDYLTRAPLFELLRHLRNGVAHGNAFNIENPDKLKKFPAHNRQARVKTTEFEITSDLDGQPVLFDYMRAGDALDLLMSIEAYLTRIRERRQSGELHDLVDAVTRPAQRRRR